MVVNRHNPNTSHAVLSVHQRCRAAVWLAGATLGLLTLQTPLLAAAEGSAGTNDSRIAIYRQLLAITPTQSAEPGYPVGQGRDRRTILLVANTQKCLPLAAQLDQARVDLVFSEVKQGRLLQRNPELRAELMWYVQDHPFTDEAYRVFRFLFDGSAGNVTKKKVESLSTWAQTVEDGRYLPVTTYYLGYHLYSIGDYADAEVWIARYAEKYTENQDRNYLLQGLCYSQRGKTNEALRSLDIIATKFPASPVLAEAKFAKAWIFFEDDKIPEAQALLQKVVAEHPGTPSAVKAQQILKTLGDKH